MVPKPFSVRIFLQDGHVDGVKIIAKSKWPGRALVIPGSSLHEEIDRKELNVPGVYVLVGSSADGDLPTLHIGSADPICCDLKQYDIEKDLWTWVFVFAAKDHSLKHAHIKYLESRLIRLAEETKRSNLDNLNVPRLPELSATELADTKSFLGHILSLCPLLGLFVFERSGTDATIQHNKKAVVSEE